MSTIKKLRPLTYKQRAFIKHIIDNPKASATEAAAQTYNVNNRKTAEAIATENLAKPSIVTALAAHNELIENTLLNTVNDYKDSDKLGQRVLAVDISKYVHDKIHGKATQRIEQTTTGVTLHIDLTSSLDPTEVEQIAEQPA